MTPSKGTHFYYRAIEGREIRNSAGKIGPMVDVRASGGYVVAAGSVTPGGGYLDLGPADVEPLPGWLADLADPPTPARPNLPQTTGDARPHSRFVGLIDTVLNAPRGQRNCVLHWAACRAGEMVREGHVEREAAFRALSQAGEHIGLGDREVHNTIRSALGRAA